MQSLGCVSLLLTAHITFLFKEMRFGMDLSLSNCPLSGLLNATVYAQMIAQNLKFFGEI